MHYKFISLSVLILFSFFQVKGQIFPKEGSVLNYRLVGFSFPAKINTTNYRLQIASGSYNTEDSFVSNLINTIICDSNRIIVEVPSFAASYTWRILDTGKIGINNRFNHFSTGYIPETDTRSTRLRIIKKAEKYKDAFVFLDGNKVLYDMSGNPVWYLPEIDGLTDKKPVDLKLSPANTITLLIDDHGYEINYEGKILWEAPRSGKISGDNTEHFHHQLNRLTNGHYMLLGLESALWKMDLPGNNPMNNMAKMPFGTVLEYDEQGNLVWSWKSSEYFKKSDVIYYKGREGKLGIDVHANAFFFDEKNKAVYVSFRDINRIEKVKYPEGDILNSYGEIYKPESSESGKRLFCGQHSCNVSSEGNLYLFDNNFCYNAYLPEIEVFQESEPGKNDLKLIWEYQCKLRSEDEKKDIHYAFSSGGNVSELPDKSMFISMGNVYGEILIVSQEKKILWSGFPERWNPETNKWELIYQYRASIINNRNDLERLIWNSEK